MHKRDVDQKVGLELGYSKDGRWVIVARVQPGTLAAVFNECKAGAKLIDVRANGQLHHQQYSARCPICLIEGQPFVRGFYQFWAKSTGNFGKTQ